MVKKFSILIIRVFGLILMVLSTFIFIKNVSSLDESDVAYTTGYIVGSIPIVIGYLLFRLKVENKIEKVDD